MLKKLSLCATILFISTAAFCGNAFASAGEPEVNAPSVIWGVPFAGMLLSIALGPLVAKKIWHRHYGKIALFWAGAFLIPAMTSMGGSATLHAFLHTIIFEYIPFIVLLFSLFTVAGGICIESSLRGSPFVNTVFLLVGTLLASVMGTTGAAMVLIRPVLRANAQRAHTVHTVVFFIFLVANIGGSLTPLGDPPLFLGFLQGVHFFWTLTHLWPYFLCVAMPLLLIYYILDSFLYAREGLNANKGSTPPSPDATLTGQPNAPAFAIRGVPNILLLLCIAGTVLMSGLWKAEGGLMIDGMRIAWQNILRDGLLLGIAALSLAWTAKEIRAKNSFDFEPIKEVAKLFFGIFVSMIPVLSMLAAGKEGAFAPLIAFISHSGNEPNNFMYFWLTGSLSAFLDNAPTYLAFFQTAASAFPAGGLPATERLMTTDALTLCAISTGAVFMGAMTYIGNAPNFMVRSIAEESGIKMPGFLGYMVWSLAILFPLFMVLSFIFYI